MVIIEARTRLSSAPSPRCADMTPSKLSLRIGTIVARRRRRSHVSARHTCPVSSSRIDDGLNAIGIFIEPTALNTSITT
jgi:hypothetical protein